MNSEVTRGKPESERLEAPSENGTVSWIHSNQVSGGSSIASGGGKRKPESDESWRRLNDIWEKSGRGNGIGAKKVPSVTGKGREVERRRKVVFPFYYSPDKKVVHVVAEIRDDPGALASLLNLLGSRLNFLGTTSYTTTEGTAIFSGFAETLSRTDTPSAIQSFAAGAFSVIGCQVWEDKDGLLVDWFHTGMESGNGEPYIVLPTSGIAKTFESIVHTFGSGGETILFLEGKEFATARYESYRRMLGPNPETRVVEVSHIFEALGYGSSEVSQMSGGAIHLIQRNCFECSGPTNNGRSCSFTRGVVAGSLGAVFGKEMNCEETACRLRGDGACEFRVSPKV
jgi:predicted hydrocarbon binding protein